MKTIKIMFFVTTSVFLALATPLSVRAQNAVTTYKARCAGCHGADGKGNTAPGKALGVHDFSSETVSNASDADLDTIIASGKNKMPSYSKSLKDTEIKELVAYIRELGKQK
jgi:cytochrome c6